LKKILNPGLHIVKITELSEGVSKNKKIPYLKCRFENDYGYIPEIFYINDTGKLYLDKLFSSVNILENEVNSIHLLGKILAIRVVDDLKSEKIKNEYFRKVNGFCKSSLNTLEF